ncbi:Rapid ALkalinization Factor [Parasponia andersonii]|uniref:Rapid ALkalinization Factor n=1 Tax=Parasponia andersonii TaxID=3476 RepID=A0A2P5AP76_PARAD|nr:Rapid ALkalinization Factor [Parasponia andersonii]
MAICVSKGVILVCMIGSLVCAHLIEGSYATTISYGAIGRNRVPACSPKYPQNCVKIPINHYQRGCESGEECHERHIPPGTGDDEGEDQEIVVDHGPEHGHGHPNGLKQQTFKIRGFTSVIPFPPVIRA